MRATDLKPSNRLQISSLMGRYRYVFKLYLKFHWPGSDQRWWKYVGKVGKNRPHFLTLADALHAQTRICKNLELLDVGRIHVVKSIRLHIVKTIKIHRRANASRTHIFVDDIRFVANTVLSDA